MVYMFTAFVFCALLEFTVVNYMWRKLRPDILRNILTEPVNGGTAGPKPYDENLPSSPVIPVSVVMTVQQTVDQTYYTYYKNGLCDCGAVRFPPQYYYNINFVRRKS